MDSDSSSAAGSSVLEPVPVTNRRIANNGSLRFWRTFIYCGYFLLLVPFRMKQSKTTGLYKVTTNAFQKTGCFIVASIMVLNIIRLGKTVLQHIPSQQNAPFYFVVASFLFFITNHGIFFYNFWFKSKYFQKVFDIVLTSNLFTDNQRNARKDKFHTIALCVMFTLFALISFLEIFEERGWDMKNIFNYFLNSSEELFFSDNHTIGNAKWTKTPPSVIRIVMTVVFMVADAYSQLLLCYCDLIFTLTVLFYRDIVNSYIAMLPRVPHSEIMEYYLHYNSMVNCVNKATGLFTMSFVMGTLPYYADNTGSLFEFTTIIEKIKFLVFCLYTTGFLYLAAKFQSKMDTQMKKWCFSGRNYSKVEMSELTMLLNELADKGNTGISAFGYFTITFNFLSSFTGLLITYTLILIDFRN